MRRLELKWVSIASVDFSKFPDRDLLNSPKTMESDFVFIFMRGRSLSRAPGANERREFVSRNFVVPVILIFIFNAKRFFAQRRYFVLVAIAAKGSHMFLQLGPPFIGFYEKSLLCAPKKNSREENGRADPAATCPSRLPGCAQATRQAVSPV